MKGTIYLFVAEGTEEVEALAIVDVIRRAGLAVRIISITGNALVTSSHGVRLYADGVFEEEKFDDVAMLVLPGGMPGSTNLAAHAGLCELIKHHAATATPLAAICAAPLVYGRLGVLEGRRATCYPGFEPELRGAVCTGALVERDGNIFTGRGPAAAFPLGFAIVEHFLGTEKVNAMKASMQFC